MKSTLVRTPLVYMLREPSLLKDHTRISYFVGDQVIMDMDILTEVLPSSGPVDPMFCTQLLITPHDHLSCLADIFALAKAKATSGEAWEASLARIQALLEGPQS